MSNSLVIRILAVMILLAPWAFISPAQTSAVNTAQREACLIKLAQPVYPPLARQARITGDVELTLDIGKDGSVQSAVVTRGHPMLKQAALQSAQRSQYDCRNCGESSTPFQLMHTFQLAGAEDCCKATDENSNASQSDQPVPRVIQSQNHVTVIDRPTCICDPGADVRKSRSLKCLYLWKCSSH